jgi:hypothetical protein
MTMLCNQGIHTDREITANKPDIIIKNKKEKTSILINVAIPVDRKDQNSSYSLRDGSANIQIEAHLI